VILRNEGLRGLMAGLGTAYCYQIMLNGCRLGFYEPLRTSVTSLFHDSPLEQNFAINIFAGASSGVLGAAVGSPFFLIKTRLQSYSPFLPVGTQHKYKGALDGFGKVYAAEGLKGWYRGAGAAMIRTGFGSSVQLPTYFFAKRRLQKHLGMTEGVGLHLASSAASGFVVCCVMHPPDTVMSRMYNQTGDKYKSAIDCLLKTVKTEGVLAIYKGFTAHLARILPHTVRSFPQTYPHAAGDEVDRTADLDLDAGGADDEGGAADRAAGFPGLDALGGRDGGIREGIDISFVE